MALFLLTLNTSHELSNFRVETQQPKEYDFVSPQKKFQEI